MLRTLRIAKTILTLTLVLTIVVAIGGLIFLNKVGISGKHGAWLKKELATHGVHLSFETLRFDLKRGIIATDVSLFADRDHLQPLLKADELIIDLDKTKALRGKFKLYRLEVANGTASVPVNQEGRTVHASEINGSLAITENKRAILQRTSGIIEGIRVHLSTDLKLPSLTSKDLQVQPQDALGSNHILGLILDELALWTLSPSAPPELSFTLKGDLSRSEKLQTSFKLSASQLSRNDYKLNQLIIAGDLQSQVLTIDEILLQDESGSATGQADWSIDRRNGRFDLISTLQLQDFLTNCFGIIILQDLKLDEPPVLNLNGMFSAPIDGDFSIRATGHGDISKFEFLGSEFEKLSSDFSWRDGDLYLRDLEVSRDGDRLNGTLMIMEDLIRFDVKSTLPLEAFRPFIKADGGLDRALREVTFLDDAVVDLDVSGTLNRWDLTDWTANGQAYLKHLSYRDTGIHSLATSYEFKDGRAEFSNIKALLNDDKEYARLRYQGKPSEELQADRVLYDSRTRFTTISNLRGKVWPTPIVRIFAPKTAKHLEENYRFHQLPSLTLNGRFAGTREEQGQTMFSVQATTSGTTDYPFLGYNLPLHNLSADIVVEGAGITIKNLVANTLEGSISGSVFCDVTPGQKTKYRGAIKWDDLSFRRLSQVYEFEEEEKGKLRGNIDFNGVAGGARGFNADGLVSIEGGNLVALPILGPLSPIIAGLLGDKRMGYERAKNASASFAVINGILQTKDFTAFSTSITLTGEGWIDLLTEKMDMIIRVNARGLLGLLTLPLQPLKGIFQFRAEGSYSAPNWRSSPFTRPSKGKDDPIFQQPGKAILVPE